MLQETSYLAQLHAEHKARQARIYGSVKTNAAVSEAKRIKEKQDEEREAIRRYRKTARYKAWVQSWKFMVQLAQRCETYSKNKVISTRSIKAFVVRQYVVNRNVQAETDKVDSIILETAKKYGTTLSEIISDKRYAGVMMQARYECFWRAAKETHL